MQYTFTYVGANSNSLPFPVNCPDLSGDYDLLKIELKDVAYSFQNASSRVVYLTTSSSSYSNPICTLFWYTGDTTTFRFNAPDVSIIFKLVGVKYSSSVATTNQFIYITDNYSITFNDNKTAYFYILRNSSSTDVLTYVTLNAYLGKSVN